MLLSPCASFFPYTTLFRSRVCQADAVSSPAPSGVALAASTGGISGTSAPFEAPDRKSTRLNSSHLVISYAVFCLKKKNTDELLTEREKEKLINKKVNRMNI